MNEEEEKANLGLATTEKLIRELITRFKMDALNLNNNIDQIKYMDRAITMGILLGSMSPEDREYRTVDHD
jgi:hypothetical protein